MADARESVLDAFEHILVEHGPRGATLDAVAAAAGVSKGGLLYHFPSKDALAEGLFARMRDRGAADVERMRRVPEGAVHYYLEAAANCTPSGEFGSTYIATTRLAEQADSRARDVLLELVAAWRAVLEEVTGDDDVAQVLVLLGDGIYFNGTIGGLEKFDLARVLAFADRLVADASDTW